MRFRCSCAYRRSSRIWFPIPREGTAVQVADLSRDLSASNVCSIRFPSTALRTRTLPPSAAAIAKTKEFPPWRSPCSFLKPSSAREWALVLRSVFLRIPANAHR